MKYLVWTVVLALAGLAVYAVSRPSATPSAAPTGFVFQEMEFDFGTIKQSRGVMTHAFPFVYEGARSVVVTGLPTSCGCTTATIEPSTIEPGMRGIVTVAFDPNLHAEPEGHFYKTVTLLMSPEILPAPELKIWAQIDLDLGAQAYKEQVHEGELLLETENLAPEKDYRTIRAATLKQALEDKHFFLVDVHTPEQAHIKGTDAVLAYDRLADHLDELPQDKEETIVVYCRSGSMSQQAAQTLAQAGYTNVIHVEGGLQAFNAL